MLPKGSRFIHPRKVHVIIGPPISAAGGRRRRVPRAVVREVTGELHTTLQDLFDEAQRHAGA